MTTQATPELVITYLDPTTLEVDPGNPRTIDPEAADKLKAGLAAFGLVEPLVVNGRTGLLVSGHQRRALALELGIDLVPVVVVDLDDPEAKALGVLLNNESAMGQWDPDLLTIRLEELEAADILELTAFDISDLKSSDADEVSFQARGHGWAQLEHRIKCPHPKGGACPICSAIKKVLDLLEAEL